MVRKSGWLIFLVLLGAVLALVYLVVGPAIRLGMVYSLERATGAEVNIAKASLSLTPLAINIHDLQVTDKEQPTHNLVRFDRAQVALEVWPALLGYYVINDLSVDGMAYGTERSSPGKVYDRPEDESDEQEKVDLAEVLQLDLPDADELLARANLQTVAKGEALEQQASTQKMQLEGLKSQLPNEENLARIEASIQALTDSGVESPADLATKREQLGALQDELRAERDALRQVRQGLRQSRDLLQQSVTELQEASASDWQQLQELANISEGGLAPISQILLGDLWGERIAQLETVYRLVRPYIPDSFGGEESPEGPTLPNRILPLPAQPYPNFWVKNARIHWLMGGGEATIQMQDITAQHDIIDAVTRFSMDVQDLPQLSALQLDGDFEIAEHMVTNLTWQLDGLSLDKQVIGSGESALEMASGLLMSTGSLELVDNRLNQEAQVRLEQPEFGVEGNRYIQQLAELLNQQDAIPVTLSASGLVSRPDVSVRSSLDQVIGDALLGEAKEKVADLQQDLRTKLDNELQQQLGAQEDWRAMLNQQEGEAEAVEDRIEEMLAAQLGDLKEDATDRLREGLRDRIGR